MSGVSAMRTLPTICVQRCNVSQVSLHAASGKSGHVAFSLNRKSSLTNAQYRRASGMLPHDAFFTKCSWRSRKVLHLHLTAGFGTEYGCRDVRDQGESWSISGLACQRGRTAAHDPLAEITATREATKFPKCGRL